MTPANELLCVEQTLQSKSHFSKALVPAETTFRVCHCGAGLVVLWSGLKLAMKSLSLEAS